MIIGVSGYARSGKDTFFEILKRELSGSKKVSRVALADCIKEDLKPLLTENFNIDPFNCTDDQKNIIRPLMVTYGTHVARKLNKNHWINKIKQKLIKNESLGCISVITDVRYMNEQTFLKENFNNSIFVHISRIGFGPANKEEEINTPKLKINSDYEISWKSFSSSNEEGEPFVKSFINERIKKRN